MVKFHVVVVKWVAFRKKKLLKLLPFGPQLLDMQLEVETWVSDLWREGWIKKEHPSLSWGATIFLLVAFHATCDDIRPNRSPPLTTWDYVVKSEFLRCNHFTTILTSCVVTNQNITAGAWDRSAPTLGPSVFYDNNSRHTHS